MYTRILELSNVEGAAAFFGRTFVHSGVEVIKVEHPHREPPWNPADAYLNAGKSRVAASHTPAINNPSAEIQRKKSQSFPGANRGSVR